jgi:hypothetical protein
VPTSHLSRSLATADAITGQLFLAITIARLVAMQVGGVGERSSAEAIDEHTAKAVHHVRTLVM